MNGSWACVILGESAVPTTATLTVEMKEAHLFRSLQNVPATTLRLHSAPRTGRRSGEMELWCRDFHTYVSLSVYRKETLKSNQTSEFCVRHHRGKKIKYTPGWRLNDLLILVKCAQAWEQFPSYLLINYHKTRRFHVTWGTAREHLATAS